MALDAADKAGKAHISAIDLVIGAISSIVDDSVQFYFDVLSCGTAAEGARLRFRREPALALCLACGQTTAVAPPLPTHCAYCQSQLLKVSGGDQFYVESIEVDDEA